MAQQSEGIPNNAGVLPPAILPVAISDKAILVAEELRLPNPRLPSRMDSFKFKKENGGSTWMFAAIAVPTIGLLMLLTLLLVAEPVENTDRRLGMNDSTFWKGRWRKSHIPRKNIFIIDINSPNFPTQEKLAALESCLTTNKKNEVYQVTICQDPNQSRNFTVLDNMKKKHSNFHFLYQTAQSYFRGSFFQDAVNDPADIMLFKAQLLILWRYAGMVISPDWTSLKPLDKLFSKDDKTIVVGTNNGHVGLVSVHNTCNARIFDVMRELKRMKSTNLSACDAIDRIAYKSKNNFKQISSPHICNNNTVNDKCVLLHLAPTIPTKENKDIKSVQLNGPKIANVSIGGEPQSFTLRMPTVVRRFLIFG